MDPRSISMGMKTGDRSDLGLKIYRGEEEEVNFFTFSLPISFPFRLGIFLSGFHTDLA